MGTIDRSKEAAAAARSAIRDTAERSRSVASDQGERLRELSQDAWRYLDRRGVAGVSRDAVGAARHHPFVAAAVVVGLAGLAVFLFRRD